MDLDPLLIILILVKTLFIILKVNTSGSIVNNNKLALDPLLIGYGSMLIILWLCLMYVYLLQEVYYLLLLDLFLTN